MIMDEVTPFLPEEIIRNILIRLAVESLVRFRCVCKHWKNLIKSPSFIADHLHHSTHQNPSRLLQPKQEGKFISQLYVLDREMQVLDLATVPLFDDARFRVKGSCNGLLCVAIHEQGTYPPPLLLCNPATRDIIMLPRSADEYCSEYEYHLGFGFSPIVDDYKVVRTYGERGFIYKVEVYSLSTGSWKEIDFDSIGGTQFVSDALTANGSMFWSGLLFDLESDGDDIEVIVSFDIATEKLEFVPMPDIGNDSVYRVMVYEDKLAIFDHHIRDAEHGCMFDLWVMEADEGKRSWSKIFSSGCSAVGFLVPAAIFWKGDFVYNVNELPELGGEAENGMNTVLFLLNVSTNKVKIFITRRCGNCNAAIFNYAESLVPVEPST